MVSNPELPPGRSLATIRPSPAAEEDLGNGEPMEFGRGCYVVLSFEFVKVTPPIMVRLRGPVRSCCSGAIVLHLQWLGLWNMFWKSLKQW